MGRPERIRGLAVGRWIEHLVKGWQWIANLINADEALIGASKIVRKEPGKLTILNQSVESSLRIPLFFRR